jgi:cell division protein FtsB
MVVRTRLRAILIPLISYCVAAAAVSYFVYQARYGARGLETRVEYKTQIASVTAEYEALRAEHQLWQHRVDLMQSDSVDRDLLEEEAHALLSRFDRRDLVIFADPATGK